MPPRFAGWAFCTLIACGAICPTEAQEIDSSKPATSRVEVGVNPGNYVLDAGDEISIRVIDLDEIPDRPVRVDSHGDISLPVAGQIHAADLTLSQLQALITEKVRIYVKQPSVSVTLIQAREQPVTVVGAVGSPGIKQVHGPRRLLEIISEAGGLRADAGPTIKITRPVSSGTIPLDGSHLDSSGAYYVAEVFISSLIKAQNPGENILLRPHDIVAVPPAEFVYVLGEVAKPAGYEITGSLTISVLDAVAKAGGVNRNASSSQTRVLRLAPGKAERTEFIVNLNRMLSGKDKDFELKPHDILYVPTNRGKVVTTRALEAMVGAGSSIAVFRGSR